MCLFVFDPFIRTAIHNTYGFYHPLTSLEARFVSFKEREDHSACCWLELEMGKLTPPTYTR